MESHPPESLKEDDLPKLFLHSLMNFSFLEIPLTDYFLWDYLPGPLSIKIPRPIPASAIIDI